MLQRIEELSNLHGVTGDEGRVRAYIKSALLGVGEMRTDAMGNLYVHKKGPRPRVMVTAHMDEVGFIIRGFKEDGTLSYGTRSIDSRVAAGKRVVIGPNNVPGVIGVRAIHLQTDEEFKKAYDHDELFIDIGAKDKADAEQRVQIGDYASFDTAFAQMGNLMAGKALDDRVGCAILMELLGKTYPCDFYGVFTVQEEAGLRGAEAAVYNVQPDLALVLECTPARDLPGTPEGDISTRIFSGAAITLMDGATIPKPAMTKALISCAAETGIPYQIRSNPKGGTDAGAIHKALFGCVTGGISVPCRYLHTPNSMVAIQDVEAALSLADTFFASKKFLEVL